MRLELVDISKSYPAVKANDGVNLHVGPGQIHAVAHFTWELDRLPGLDRLIDALAIGGDR